jgi:thioredoxin 1
MKTAALVLLSAILLSLPVLAADSKPVTLTQSNFKEVTSQGVVLVDFWAEWCGPCRLMAPVINSLAAKYEGRVVFGKVDVDANPDLANQFRIRGIPNFKLFKNGKVVDQIEGPVPKEQISAMIDKHLK